MRLELIGIVAATAALAAGLQAAGAQESFFNDRYCTRGGGNSLMMDCSFSTWRQCIESARGLGRWCTENPRWHAPRQPSPTARGGNGRR